MSFETIGFTALFHPAFRIDSTSLAAHLAIENRIRPHAEKVLLVRLAIGAGRGAPVTSVTGRLPRPRVRADAVERRFDLMRLELDYPEAGRTRRMLEECAVSLDAVDDAIATRLRLEQIVDRFIAGLWRNRRGREAVCREAFLDLDLRGHCVRAIGLGLLGAHRAVDATPSDDAAAAARQHLLLRHGLAEWHELRSKLLDTWGVEEGTIEHYIRSYATALEARRSHRGRTPLPRPATESRIEPPAERLRKAGDSFDRTIPPEQTVQRLMARRRHYGITRVTDVTGLDDLGIPVHCAFRPRSVSAASVHSGKGLTTIDSLASALAEAIEADCCERFHPPDLIRATLADARRQHAVADLPASAVPGGRGIPEDLLLDWVLVEDLLATGRERHVLLPLEFVQQGSAHPERRPLFGVTMSAGLASGNVREEAINHGLSELIERDAVAIFTFRAKYLRQDLQRHYRRLDLCDLPERARALIEKVRAAGRHLALVDATRDIAVATVICKISSADGSYCGGFGASLSAERAVLRAITEAAQTSTANIQGAREDLALLARDPRIHERTFGLESARARELFDDPAAPTCSFASLPSQFHEYVDHDLDALLNALRACGITHAYVCDVSDEACIDFRVVRVVVPELERSRLDCIGPRRLRCVLEL